MNTYKCAIVFDYILKLIRITLILSDLILTFFSRYLNINIFDYIYGTSNYIHIILYNA